MATSDQRKKAGTEILKKYGRAAGSDRYAAAADAIADILLSVAEHDREASQILHAAEADYRSCLETEGFGSEG